MADQTWTRVVVAVDAHRAELAADRLWGFGPAAIEEQPGDGHVLLLAGFADPGAARAAADALEADGFGVVRVVPVDPDDQAAALDGWRAWARPVPAGPFLVVPTWLPVDASAPEARRIVVRVDPAHSFGSGSHPTTRLVLARLVPLVRADGRVLDVGCGSGILAVAAALAGARSVEGVDVDPGAPPATLANARANGVAAQVRASTETLAEVAARPGGLGRFDLVLANLLAPVVVDLAAELAAAVSPGGHLVVSGLLADRWEEAIDVVTNAASPHGSLAVTGLDEEDGWVAVTLARPT